MMKGIWLLLLLISEFAKCQRCVWGDAIEDVTLTSQGGNEVFSNSSLDVSQCLDKCDADLTCESIVTSVSGCVGFSCHVDASSTNCRGSKVSITQVSRYYACLDAAGCDYDALSLPNDFTYTGANCIPGGTVASGTTCPIRSGDTYCGFPTCSGGIWNETVIKCPEFDECTIPANYELCLQAGQTCVDIGLVSLDDWECKCLSPAVNNPQSGIRSVATCFRTGECNLYHQYCAVWGQGCFDQSQAIGDWTCTCPPPSQPEQRNTPRLNGERYGCTLDECVVRCPTCWTAQNCTLAGEVCRDRNTSHLSLGDWTCVPINTTEQADCGYDTELSCLSDIDCSWSGAGDNGTCATIGFTPTPPADDDINPLVLVITFIGGLIFCIGCVVFALSLRGDKKGKKHKEPNFPPEGGNELEAHQPHGGSDREVGVGFESQQPPPPLEDPLLPESVRRFETDSMYPSHGPSPGDKPPDDADEEFIITRDDLVRMSHRYPQPASSVGYHPPPNDLSNLPI